MYVGSVVGQYRFRVFVSVRGLGFFFSQRLTGRTNWRLTFWIFGYLKLAFIGFVDLDHWNGVCLSVDMSICLSMLQTQNWKQGPTETGLWRGSGYINVYMYI